MNDNARKWVATLRSGNYSQGIGVLRRNDKFCCLGVACELYRQENTNSSQWDGTRYKDTSGISFYQALAFTTAKDPYQVSHLPHEVKEWLGVQSSLGEYYQSENTSLALAFENDSGRSFREIADLIESEPEGLFTEAKPQTVIESLEAEITEVVANA